MTFDQLCEQFHWTKLTVHQYQQIHQLVGNPDAIVRLEDIVHVVTGKTVRELAEIYPDFDVELLYSNCGPMIGEPWPTDRTPYIEVNGQHYELKYHVGQLKVKQIKQIEALKLYDADNFHKTFGVNDIANLHKIAAIIAENVDSNAPQLSFEELSEVMLQAPFVPVFNAVIFCREGRVENIRTLEEIGRQLKTFGEKNVALDKKLKLD